jgi:hypothetical protein
LHHSAATVTAVERKRVHLRAIRLNAFRVISGKKYGEHDKA